MSRRCMYVWLAFIGMEFCCLPAIAITQTVSITNRMDIRCAQGDCKTFCIGNTPKPLVISEKCDGHYNISIAPGEKKEIPLTSEGDFTSFCLEDGHQQNVKISLNSSNPSVVVIAWRGFGMIKPIALFPRQIFAKPVFNDQVVTPCRTKKV